MRTSFRFPRLENALYQIKRIQARFDEESFPYRNQDMIRGKLDEDNNLEILSVDKLPTRWIDLPPEINLDQYENVHVGN